MTSIDEIVRELSGLMEKATPGPWIDPPSRGEGKKPCPYLASKDGNGEVIVGRFDYCSVFDKPLIASMRNHLPALLSALARSRRMEEALRPFVAAFETARAKHMKRSAQAVAQGRIWFDEMPADWPCEGLEFSMGVYRAARAALEDT